MLKSNKTERTNTKRQIRALYDTNVFAFYVSSVPVVRLDHVSGVYSVVK